MGTTKMKRSMVKFALVLLLALLSGCSRVEKILSVFATEPAGTQAYVESATEAAETAAPTQAPTEPPETEPPVVTVTYYTTRDTAAYMEPSGEAELHCELDAYTQVQVIGGEADWCEVLMDGEPFDIPADSLRPKAQCSD